MSTGLNEQLPLPFNSITKDRINNAAAKDFKEAFSFYDFLQNTEIRLTYQQYNNAYKNYLFVWSEVKRNSSSQSQQLIRDRYVELLKDISLNYLTFEEKRFLKLANFNDENDLDIIIPLYSKKIIEICKYHAEKREKTKHSVHKNQERGTKKSVEGAIHDSLTDYVLVSDDQNLAYNLPKLKIEEIISTLDIEIEELIDVYTTYLDNNPDAGFELYDTKNILRQELFTANTNSIDGNIFLDFDAATRKYIFEILSIFLKETGRIFAINYDITKADLNCKSGDKLYELITKYKDYASNILDLKSILIKKFIGADFYYIKTGDSKNSIETGKLFEAENPSGNLLNRHFPSTATIEENSLKTLRKIGLFFKPEKTGLLYFSVPKNHFEIDYSKLEPNKLYIYPDPNRYGNTTGLTNTHFNDYPLIHTQDYTSLIKKISDGFSEGDIYSNPSEQNFYAYIAKNQLSNSKILNNKGLELNFLSLANKGKITRWQSDIYGNQFALFEPTKLKEYKDERLTKNQSITSYHKFDGGVFLFDDGNQLPSLFSSDKIQWPGSIFSSNYYYNILLDGGVGGTLNGVMIRPTLGSPIYDGLDFSIPSTNTFSFEINRSSISWDTYTIIYNCGSFYDSLPVETSFTYSYILSSILFEDIDGGNFILDEKYDEFDSSKNIFLDEVKENCNTKIINLSSITKKEIYVKNIIDRNILNINVAFSNILKKYNYNVLLSSELIYDLKDFGIYNDILYIRTKNYAIFERYGFDGKFNPLNTPSNALSGNLSEPFFFENKNFAILCKIDLLSANNINSIIVPTIYKISYDNTNIEEIIYTYDNSLSGYDEFKNPLPVAFTRVSKPIITYNSRNKIYAICCTLYDNNNMPYLYKIFFKYNNIELMILRINLISMMKAGSYTTIDFINNQHASLFNFNPLNSICTLQTSIEGSLDFYGI